jgi:hypothetical protein
MDQRAELCACILVYDSQSFRTPAAFSELEFRLPSDSERTVKRREHGRAWVWA